MTIVSLILIGYLVPFSEISLASGICYFFNIIVSCICSVEVSGNLDSSGASKLFVVSARTARSLSRFVVFKTSGTVLCFLYFQGYLNQLY